MLFRYVDNVFAGHGVVWNTGEPPVDGATDLGYMFLVVAVKYLGVSTQAAALIVNTIAFLSVAALIFVYALRRTCLGLAVLLTAIFISSPAVGIINVGFGAVFFSGSVALTALAMFRFTDDPTRRNAIYFGCAGAVSGIIRPEGFLIAGVLLITAIAASGRPALRSVIWAIATLFLAAFAFVAVRWQYFGYPFPNPYYKKGGGRIHFSGLLSSVQFALSSGFISIVLLTATAILAGLNRRAISYLASIAALLGMWALLSSEMNYGFRFQFPILVVILLMVVDIFSRNASRLTARIAAFPKMVLRSVPAIVILIVMVNAAVTLPVVHQSMTQLLTWRIAETPQEKIAKALAASGEDDLVVATTEAGYVCWKSGWRCIDLWGLNDKRIAHEGLLDQAALMDLHPDVIVAHVPTSPNARSIHESSAEFPVRGWEQMTDPVIRFAEGNNYVLAAIAEPQPDSGFAVYVRPEVARNTKVIQELAAISPSIEEYYGPLRGKKPALPTNE